VWASISIDAIKLMNLMAHKVINFTGINIIYVSPFNHHGSRGRDQCKGNPELTIPNAQNYSQPGLVIWAIARCELIGLYVGLMWCSSAIGRLRFLSMGRFTRR
jgi:hypothetical protein